MGDHSLPEPEPPTDPAGAPTVPAAAEAPKTVEVKLIVVTVLATLLYAIGGAVQDNTSILDGLPPWAQSLILAVLPTLIASAAGYRVPSNRV